MDTNGVIRTNATVDPEFSAMITVADPQRKQPPKKKVPPAYPTHAQWVIAYQDIFRNMAGSNDYYNAIYDVGGAAANYGGAITLFPSNPTNAQTFPMRWPWTNPVVNVPIQTLTKDSQGLLSLLAETNSRNFYYSGHSTPRGLPYLSSDKIQLGLQKRYYRFVFIDGCSSASGPIAASFGNNANRDLPFSYYQTRGIRPRAFLGYDRDVHYAQGGTFVENGVTYNRKVPDCVHYFLSNFIFYWYFIDHDLDAALSDAYINNVPPPSGGPWDNGANLKLFGYGGLGMDDFNWRSQWQN